MGMGTKTGRGVGGSKGNKDVVQNKNTMAPTSRPKSMIGSDGGGSGMKNIKDKQFPGWKT